MSETEPRDRLAENLKHLRPAAGAIDVRSLFYQAGYEAAKSERSAGRKSVIQGIVAACIVTLVLVGPVSFRAGRMAANRSESRLVQESMPSSEAVRSQDKRFSIAGPDGLRRDAGREGPDGLRRDAGREGSIAVPDGSRRDAGREGSRAGPDESRRVAGEDSRWFALLDGWVESEKLDRQAASMLTVSHASLVAGEDSTWDWKRFPLQVAEDTLYRSISVTESETSPSLTSIGLQELAISLETIR